MTTETQTTPANKKNIALAHDFLTVWGGAERVFRVMAEMYPEAPIYTLYYDEDFVRNYFPGRTIRTSFLQKLPRWLRTSTLAYPLYPVAVETLDLRDFDTVLSSSGAWMKGLVTRLHTRHIAYLHSPMRYVWDTFHEHPRLKSGFQFGKRLLLSYLRLWDKEAAARPDVLLVNSEYTRLRVEKYYRQEATTVYPPVALRRKQPQRCLTDDIREQDGERKPFLLVARLVASKHIDVAIEAFNKLGLPLTIVGEGNDEERLRSLAAKNIVFLGAVSDERLAELYAGARALIQPSEEDFGLVAAEALSSGVPVISYREGAIREILIPGETGVLFDALVPEALADGVRQFLQAERQYADAARKQSAENRFPLGAFQSVLWHEVDKS